MLAQIVQQLADVRLSMCEDSQIITRTDLCDHQETAFVVEHCRAKSASPGTEPEPGSILSEGCGQSGERLRLEWLMRGMFDGQSVGAQHQDRFDAFACHQAAHDIS